MSKEIIFVDGLIVKEHTFPDGNTNQNLAFKIEEITEFFQKHNDNGWVNIVLTKSKAGKRYAKLDTWKKDNTQQGSQPQPKGGNYPPMPNDMQGNQQGNNNDTFEDVPF